ncbi:MAG: AAA family ATPase [Acidimicrobiia bacterium]
MLPDPALDHAVRAFCDALAPWVRQLAASVTGVDAERVDVDVQVEAYNLAAAFIDADGLHTDPELWAFIATFGPRFGGSLARSAPADVRTARLLAERVRFLDRPSELVEVLLAADARDGTDLASLYYDRSLAIGFAVASIDQHTATAELAAIEAFRGRLLDRIAAVRGVARREAAHRVAAPPVAEAAPEPDLPPARPVDEVLAELDELIGLDAVKAEVKRVADLTRVQLLRAERGLPVLAQSRHLVFSGNPGTGKTTVARLLAEIYRSLGVVGRGHLVEVDRAGLVAGFVGQTAPKVTAVFDEADEGVLLIDEAYALVRGSETDFGREAIDTIVKLVEDRRDRIVVIMAGYPDEMAQLVAANPGLRSRFPKTIHFPDYDTDELLAIFDVRCREGGYETTHEARAEVRSHLDATARGKGFGNGRVARNLFEEAVARQASRIVSIEEPTDDQLRTLEAADIPDRSAADGAPA